MAGRLSILTRSPCELISPLGGIGSFHVSLSAGRALSFAHDRDTTRRTSLAGNAGDGSADLGLQNGRPERFRT
jgi:hypothetical protein